MKTQHTPGPWRFEGGIVVTDIYVGGRDPHQLCPIAKMDRETQYTKPTERDANARLIAAAPELLEALEAILQWADPYALPNCDENQKTVQAARAIIAKAKGE